MRKLISYANKRFKNLSKGLESYGHVEDSEVLHQIRVEVKKIKVLLNLMNASIKKFKGHQKFIPFRAIFRRAGEIRQPEVAYKLLLKYQIGGVKDDQIPRLRKVDETTRIFQKETPRFMESVRRTKKKIRKGLRKISRTNARKYLKEKRREVERLLFPTFKRGNLHKARKITKEIIYLRWLGGHRDQDVFYKEVENIIGLWHDKQMLLPILRRNKSTEDIGRLKEASKKDLVNLKIRVAEYYGHS